MKKNIVLNSKQRRLVEEHMDIVKWVIYSHIKANESIHGLGHDDLYQEGCLLLCRAAATYDETRAQFKTYAQVVVKNGLVSYCRAVWGKQKNTADMEDSQLISLGEDDHSLRYAMGQDPEAVLADAEIFGLLESVKTEYSGIARLGIEALELKVKGYTGAEVAKLWGVSQNNVGAWISRAKKKLSENEGFVNGIRDA